jgi:hypothetical protein
MKWIKENWFKIIVIALSLYALNDLPIGFYQVLRWTIFLSSIYLSYLNYRGDRQKFLWVFIPIGILFNPIVPFILEKNTWHIIDVIIALIFAISMFPRNFIEVKRQVNKKYIAYLSLSIILVIMVIGASIFIWNNFSVGINKEYLLKQSVERYSDLLTIGLAEQAQAYNEFLTPESKAKVTYRNEDIPFTPEQVEAEQIRKANCQRGTGRLSDFKCLIYSPKHEQIQKEVSSLETFTKHATTRKNDWKDIKVDRIVFPSKNRADVLLKFTNRSSKSDNYLETWYFQNGKWLRDF